MPYAGGSLSDEPVADVELFVRWLGIAAFLPVMSFQTPPWVFDKDWVSVTVASFNAVKKKIISFFIHFHKLLFFCEYILLPVVLHIVLLYCLFQ